jgi:hypothetical protein
VLHARHGGAIRAPLVRRAQDGAARAGGSRRRDAAAGQWAWRRCRALDAWRFEAQGTRRIILERLAAIGAPAAPLFIERLHQTPWYVQRNLLALLARLRTLPEGFSARPWAASDEVTVRYHALGVMLRHASERDEAIHLALGDATRAWCASLDAAAGGRCASRSRG